MKRPLTTQGAVLGNTGLLCATVVLWTLITSGYGDTVVVLVVIGFFVLMSSVW